MQGGRIHDLAESKAMGILSSDEAEELALYGRGAKPLRSSSGSFARTFNQPSVGNTTMKIAINNTRLAFPVLFKPETFNGEGAPAYSASLLLPPGHPAIKAIQDGIEEVGSAKWGKSWAAIKKTAEKKDLNCLHDGDLKAKYAGFEGNMYVSVRAPEDKRPTVVDRNRTPLTAADGKIYGGCYVNAIVVLWAQDNQFGQRVNAQITGVQFYKDGDSFGGGAMAASEDDFADIAEGADADDLG